MGLLYISPWIIGFIAFGVYPLGSSIYYSLTNYNILGKPDFIGFKNYLYMFTKDRDFYHSLWVTFKYVLYSVPMKILSALFFALILNQSIGFIKQYRTIFYLPSIFAGNISIALLWKFLFMPRGIINNLIARLGIPSVPWLTDPKFALFTISLINIWAFGASMVIFLVGLKQIPKELYEAGRVDGASKIRLFFMITLPLLTPQILFNLVMQTIAAFQSFTAAFVITGGGPLKSTFVYSLKIYQEGFSFFKMGYAAALSWILFIIIMAATLILFKSSKSWLHYQDSGEEGIL
ncbi:sugar ABC transporter permease [bacterium]|nr:sugar ABC transporter permease [bacterium]